MAKYITELISDVRTMLRSQTGSDAGEHFTDDELKTAIYDILVEVSDVSPYMVKEELTTTADTRDIDISDVGDLLEVELVEYPVDQVPPKYRNFDQRETGKITVDYSSNLPGDEDIYLYCRKLHSVNLTSSTLNPKEERVVILGTMAKAASLGLNEARTRIREASDKIAEVDIAIDNMSVRITQAIADLTSGRAYIAVKQTEAIAAIDTMASEVDTARTDLTTGRALIGDKKTQAVAALDNVGARITQAITDLTSGRAQIDDERAEASSAIDSVDDRITQALADLTSGRAYINKINVGGRPQTDYAGYAVRDLESAGTFLGQARGYLGMASSSARYADYAARDMQAANAYINEARGYMALDIITDEHAGYSARQLQMAGSLLSQARGYLELSRPAVEYGNYAARELSNANAYLNQSAGYAREVTSQLNVARMITGLQGIVDRATAEYQRALRTIVKRKVSERYSTS